MKLTNFFLNLPFVSLLRMPAHAKHGWPMPPASYFIQRIPAPPTEGDAVDISDLEYVLAVPAVWRLVRLLAFYPSEPKSIPTHTGGTPVPLSKNPKASCFWYHSVVEFPLRVRRPTVSLKIPLPAIRQPLRLMAALSRHT